MTGLKRLAATHPVLFGILITFSVLVLYIVAGVFAAAMTRDGVSRNLVEATGRFSAAGLFIGLLWSFGWLDGSGITVRGSWTAWLVTLLLIAYETTVFQLAFFGDLSIQASSPGLSLAVALNALATGPLEEIPFRAVILFAFLRLWGGTRKGIIRSVLYSAVIFSASHLIHLALGRPTDMVAMKLVMTFLSGIYFAALVLRWKSIWTVVLFHGVLNAVLSIRAVEVQGFTETAAALGTIIPFQLPLVALGIYWIAKAPARVGQPQAEH
jgi:hypothetical protein